MAKGKPKTPTNPAPTNTGAWEASLASTLVNDDELKTSVYLVSPDKVEDKLQLQLLGSAVETNVRQKFVYIEKDSLVAQAKDNSKSKDNGSKTPFPEIFTLFKPGDELIPSSTLAKLLKIKILEYRENELSRREELQKGKSGNASRSPVKSASPDKGAKKDAKKGGKKSPVKKESGSNIDPEAEIPRGKCHLKKRGEEKEEPAKIDDYPEFSPDLFVVCVGFEQADFIAECQKTNLPITSLVKSSSQTYSPDCSFMEHISSFNMGSKVVLPDETDGAELAARVAAHQELLDKFWSDIAEQATEVPLPAHLVDVGFENMSLPKIELDIDLKKDNERMEELLLKLYKNVADKIYSIQSSLCQFKQYYKGMDLVNVVDLSERTEEGELVHPLDTRYYNKMISLLPYESVTHVSVLNCMLEQVCEGQQPKKEEPKITEVADDPVKRQLGEMIQGLPLTLLQQSEFEGYLALKQEKVEEDEQPVVLKAADEIGMKSFHLNPKVYPLNDLSLLQHSLSNTFLELPQTSSEVLTKIQSLAYETETFCGQTSQSVVNNALRQFAFENFDCTGAKPGISRLKTPAEYFWDVEMLLGSSEVGVETLQKLKDNVVSNPIYKLDHFNYRTSYEKSALLQVLNEAYYEYPYCERLYHRHENAMLLIFHAGFSEARQSQSQWNERIHTEIGFHYFMSRTKDRFSSLLDKLPPLTPAPAPSETTAPPTPVTPAIIETEEEPEFQIPENRLEGFKKRSELKAEEQERASSGKKGKKSADKKGRKGSPSPKRKGSPSKSPKRSAGPSRQSSAKSTDKSKVEFEQVPLIPEPEMDIVLEEDQGKNLFVGFKLPNQIFEATGSVAHCHPADGSLVRVEKWGFDGKNPKTRVSLLKGGHLLSLNYALKSDMDLRNEQKAAREKQLKAEAEVAAASPETGASGAAAESTPDIATNTEEATATSALSSVPESQIPMARSVSFNAQLKSGMGMSFKKSTPPPKSVHHDGEEVVELPEPLPSTLVLSIPNGLVLQYCPQLSDADFFAIRQTYECKTDLKHKCEQVQAKTCAEEVSRLCLSNGTVVKHMKNGETVVLYPDGGYSVKRVPPPPPPAPPAAEPASTPAPPDSGSAVPTPVETPAPPPAYVVWEVTKEQGEREHVMSCGDVEVKDPLQCYTATDPESKEVMFTRMDNILSVTRPDGTRIVDHIDGTRITTVTNPNGEVGHKVECVGYATVHFSGDESKTIFGTPTRVTSSNANKSFTIEEEDGTILHISPQDNKVELRGVQPTEQKMDPASLNTIRERGTLSYSELGTHNFDLDSEICFEHTDVAGNIFNVNYEGRIVVEQPDTHIVQHLDHFYKQNEVGAYYEVEEKFRPPMRLFVIHSDETGSEIMDREKCRALFESPEKNPDVVQVVEDVESDGLAKGYTFLTPYYSSPGSKWIKEFDEGEIVPGGLVYAGTVKPAEQIIGGWEKRVSSPDTTEPELPPAIHYNQVIEESPLDNYRRELVLNGVKAHTHWLIERELNSSKASVTDERSELEKETADKMATKVGRSASTPRSPQNVHRLWRSESKQDLTEEDYSSDEENPPTAMERLEKRRNTADFVTRKYSTAVSHNPFKMKMKLKKGIIPQAKWDQITREKMEVNILKSDLRNFRVPPYFESKFGQSFLNSLREGPDMNGLSENVPSPVQGTPSDKSIETGGKGESLSTSMILIDGEENQGSAVSLTQQGTTPRPGNPTPNVATGVDVESKSGEQKSSSSSKQLSPCSDEPSPKPNRNLSPVHDEEIETPVHDMLSSRQTSQPTSGTVKSLHVDVKGDPRKSRVKIPRSIQGYKPGAEPNERFLQKEQPVRRGVKTSSVLAAGKRKHISEMRGFQVFPPEVSFGVLCPAGMYATTVTLKNVGIDSCRFQIKCPKNRDGVSVCLHSETNFVAAGMSVKFDVCVQAAEVTEIGHISLDIIITMETEVFRLPVLATVLPLQEYNERSKSGRLTRLPQHIKIIDISSFVNSASSGARHASVVSSEWRSTPTLS
ncbi:hypothetical protein ACHWQZ_G005633 [Mnemiopsis leidyi]